jgi:four helix bundle protein
LLVVGCELFVAVVTMIERTKFESLRVYQLAEKLADEIWNAVSAWDHFARYTVGKQLVHAADSVGANIAEGIGRGTAPDNRRFVRTARGSLNETKHWLRRAYKRHLLSDQAVSKLRPLMDELAPKLNAYLRSIHERSQQGTTTNDSQPTTNH